MKKKPVPGVPREQRISDEGLQRLQKQLEYSGMVINVTTKTIEWVSLWSNG